MYGREQVGRLEPQSVSIFRGYKAREQARETEKEQLGRLVEGERMWWKLTEECILWKIDCVKCS